jgi:membrane protein CcdC involved in cytochrome C biogenesis
MNLRRGFLLLSGACVGWSLKTLIPPSVEQGYRFMFWIGMFCYFVYWAILLYEKLTVKGD